MNVKAIWKAAAQASLLAALVVMALAAAPVLTGCMPVREQGEAPADLIMAVPEGVQAVPLLAAREMGYFAAQGISVDLIKVEDWREAEIKLQSGAVDGALGSLFNLIGLQELNFLVMAASTSGASYELVAVPEKSDSYAALINMNIALSDNPAELYLLEELLLEHDLVLTDVKLQIVSDSRSALEAFLKRQAEAALLPRHLGEEALSDGAVPMESGRLASLSRGVIIFSGETLQQKEEAAAAFITAVNETVVSLNEGLIDFSLLLLEQWGLSDKSFIERAVCFEMLEPVSRDAFQAARGWYVEQEQVEAVQAAYEGAVWRGAPFDDQAADPE